jgi:hypothetical protein
MFDGCTNTLQRCTQLGSVVSYQCSFYVQRELLAMIHMQIKAESALLLQSLLFEVQNQQITPNKPTGSLFEPSNTNILIECHS